MDYSRYAQIIYNKNFCANALYWISQLLISPNRFLDSLALVYILLYFEMPSLEQDINHVVPTCSSLF
jgi:hypothetical protein